MQFRDWTATALEAVNSASRDVIKLRVPREHVRSLLFCRSVEFRFRSRNGRVRMGCLGEWHVFSSIAEMAKHHRHLPRTELSAFVVASFDPSTSAQWDQCGAVRMLVPSVEFRSSKLGAYLLVDRTAVSPQALSNWFSTVNAPSDFRSTAATLAKPECDSAAEFKLYVKHILAAIAHGRASKVVAARTIQFRGDFLDISKLLERIADSQPTTFQYAVKLPDNRWFVGASPELLVRKRAGVAYSEAVAATRVSGELARIRARKEAFQTTKDASEHNMVADFIHETLANFGDVESGRAAPRVHPPLIHLVTSFRAKLAAETEICALVDAMHPTPALAGVPTSAAKEIIADNEPASRGFYGGPIGWLDHAGNGEFAVALRCALLDATSATLFAGAGIVAESDPELEAQEVMNKFSPMLQSLGIQLGEAP